MNTADQTPRIVVLQGDIVTREVDAIVNAANPSMIGGGGVDGAIHRAAGPQLVQECRRHPMTGNGIRCPVGEVRVTDGYDLPAKLVFHTVGPIYPRGRGPVFPGEMQVKAEKGDLLLARAIRACLTEAERMELRSIAFPAISCGVYGCLPWTFARLAREVLAEKDWNLDLIEFVLYNETEYEQFMVGWEPLPPEAEDLCGN